MDTFDIDDVRDNPDTLLDSTASGQFSVVTRSGQTLFLTVPFDVCAEVPGLAEAVALQLFRDQRVSLGRAARIAGLPYPDMIDHARRAGIPVIDLTGAELAQQINDFGGADD
ncbi:UPF0175 family protein [Methyloversatilis sp.]|uniref:UPF0175 family protein n=1 Tax=Methyloversatilis sp. TaxID=2569862 RepID=UPI0027348771|nr:UPF0175 family protein [Methyloversatilis sp.]MDP2867188.1 UPF0175 family protein [Methyloversatilis sp.]MDP3455338.1 UPF0175 family protein [Methyloversatilis sp.]MDP3577062.1 UPF0175 family protein [Methyloversatilis sp.]